MRIEVGKIFYRGADVKICLIGGIFGRGSEFRRALRYTPETILEKGLRAAGHDVTTLGHFAPLPAIDFDVIHVHHLSHGTVRAVLGGSAKGVVYTAHRLCIPGLNPLRNAATRFMFKHCDASVALSHFESTLQQQQFSLPPSKSFVIPNGIDSAIYEFQPKSCAGGLLRLLFVGQLIQLKRIDLLIRALAQVYFDWELRLAYHNDQELPHLQSIARKLGVSSRCVFLGSRSPAQLAKEYQRCHALVLPSSTESLPSVITEALLTGTPVLATDVGGIREQLSGFGVLIQPDSEQEILRGLNMLFDGYATLVSRADEMHHHALTEFSIDRMVAKHIALYQEVAGGITRNREPIMLHGPMLRFLERLSAYSKIRERGAP